MIWKRKRVLVGPKQPSREGVGRLILLTSNSSRDEIIEIVGASPRPSHEAMTSTQLKDRPGSPERALTPRRSIGVAGLGRARGDTVKCHTGSLVLGRQRMLLCHDFCRTATGHRVFGSHHV